jgi:hypothetical protein
MTIWRMRIACWIPKSTNAHLQYVTLIALPLQQRLHEHYVIRTYIACLVLGENERIPSFIRQHVHFICNLYLSLSLLVGFYGGGKLLYLVINTSPYQFILYRKSGPGSVMPGGMANRREE